MGDQQQAEEEGDGRGAAKTRRRNSKVKNMGRSRNLLHHADTPSGSSKDSPSASKERKRQPTRERWLLTRKTWRYMADAGRRLIPDGAYNRSEDVPKIEAYFQRVCSREPRFLLWRKSSYPGALGFRSRKHRRGKKGGSCREKASSADEAEPGQSVDLAALKKDFTHRQKSILDGYGKGQLPDVPETVVTEEEEENERELLDSLSKFLSDQREATEEHEHPTSSISTRSETGAVKKVTKETSNIESARDPSSFNNSKSGGIDYQKLVEQLQRYLSSNPQESQDNTEQQTPKGEDSDTRSLRRSTSATQRPLTTVTPYTTGTVNFEGDHQQRDVLETLRRYYSRSTCRQKVITDLLTDRKLLERLYFDLRKTRGFKPSNRTGSQFVPGLRTYSREETSSFNLRRAGNDIDGEESRYKSQEAVGGKHPQELSPFSPPPLIEIQHEPLWRDRAVQTEPIPASILVAVEDELRRVRQVKEDEPAATEKVMLHTSPRRRSSVDNDDVSPSVSDTIKRYLRMARKKSIDADKTDRFKRVNYDRNLRNIKAKPDTMGNLISEDDDVNKGCQPDESWIAALKELKLEDPILLLSPSSDQDVSPESHMSSRSSLGGAISDDNLLSPPSAGHKQHHSLLSSGHTFLSNLLHGLQHHQQQQCSDSSVTSSPSTACTTAGAMQKSKSSSSVVHHGSRLVAKKIWRSRSKSQSRSVPCTWTPQGHCCWSSMAGRTVTLNDTSLMSLTEVERRVLQKVALAKLQALNLGVTIRIPSESVTTVSGHKPKRRAYLLKRKALTTGFFDTARSKEEKEKDGTVSSPGGGLVFGIPIGQCLENDRVAAERQGGHSPNRLEDTAAGTSGLRRKSHHGSRSSFTSLIETSTSSGGGRAGEESGSCESLMSPGIAGSVPGLLDSLSCGSTTDIASAAMEHEPNIPQIVNSCFRHLENYGLHTLGIFRVSTSKKRVRQLREEFDCGKDIVLGEDHCPHDVATLLKEFFRDLPEPLLCRDLYQAFVHTQRIRNRRLQLEALQHLIQLLPVPNRDTLWALLNFLANVARNATDHRDESGEWVEGSKMDSNNLATVFAPNILHCIKPGSNKEMSIERAEERIDVINVIRTMIDHNRQLFQVPAELLDEVYIHMMDSHPEVLDTLLRKRGNLSDEVLDDPESSVTEGGGSEPSSAPRTPTQEHLENDEPGTVRRVWSREEFLHETAGMGGPDVSMRPRYKDKDRGRERGSKKRWRDEPNARRRTAELETGTERTGFSITTSASTSQISSRQRTYQQVGGMESVDVVKVRSVSVDGGSTTMVQHSGNSRLAASEDSEAMRRQSVPLPDGSRNSATGGGVITASLKIPVSGASTSFALNLDDADIPYIEDAGGGYSISSESGRQQMTIGRVIMMRWLIAAAVSILLFATHTHTQLLHHPGHHFLGPHFSGGPHEGLNFFHFPSLPSIFNPEPVVQCTPEIRRCRKHGYRTMDGSCNHLENPLLGVANTPYARILPSKYADGVVAPPVSVTGDNLTSARDISDALFPDTKNPDPIWTLATMQYGQIITHDMALAAGTTQGKAHTTKCCSENLDHERAWDSRDQTCFPIPISPVDPIYSEVGQRCMEFVRSNNDYFQGCNAGDKPAEQISAVTAYLDSSNVYGSSDGLANNLREFQGGRLRVDVKNGRPFPPSNPNKTFVCDHVQEDEACYLTGDSRANQNPQLTVFQVLQLREHNRICQALQELNPHWDDERLYQEARKIAIAEHQLVTYYEWLTIILGEENMLKNKLIYHTEGHVDDYNPQVDPSVINGFSTSAFRFLHTNIQGFLGLFDEHRSSSSALRLSDHFNRPQIIEEGNNFDDLARGMHTQPQDSSDKFFTTEITWFLFRNGKHLGQDLRAIDIQRGRDHGLASYNDYRQFCGLPKAHTFEDFLDVIDHEDVERLKQLYAHPEDVDFVVGGSLEKIARPALVGPTYLCVITEQFFRTRVGDRFFFENSGQFTLEQLNELRKGSISRLICDNGDNVQHMQPRGFEKISPSNPLVPCSQLPSPSLEPWREERHHGLFGHPHLFSHDGSHSSIFQIFKK